MVNANQVGKQKASEMVAVALRQGPREKNAHCELRWMESDGEKGEGKRRKGGEGCKCNQDRRQTCKPTQNESRRLSWLNEVWRKKIRRGF